MSRIPADQLPNPYTTGSSLEWAPAPTFPPVPGPLPADTWAAVAHGAAGGYPPATGGPTGPGRNRHDRRSLGVLIVSGLVVLALGGVAAHAIGGNDDTQRTGTSHRTDDTDPDGTDGTDGGDQTGTSGGVAANATLTTAEIGAAYSAVFGVVGSRASLDCVAAQIGDAGSQAVRLANGEALSLTEAQEAFTPFVACAPNADFLALMVPATSAVFDGQVDTTCVSDILVTFGVDGRAEARAVAYADATQFVDLLYSTFVQCSY